VDISKEKCNPRTVTHLCKDHHYETEVSSQESMRRLIPFVHETVKGVYHGDGLYPDYVVKPPLFLLRSCRTKSGWCKR
jgi:hypothetical protein